MESASATGVLDALVVLARRHGIDTSVEELRRQYVLGDDEIANGALASMASDIGLEARWVTLRWSQLPQLGGILPAMLRLRDGGALVLETVTKDEATGIVAVVSDPSAGQDVRAAIDESQMLSLWGGEILLLKRGAAVDDADRPFGFDWLLRQVLREGRLFRDIFIASLINTVFSIAPAFVVMIVVDRVLVNHSNSTLIAVSTIMVIMIIFEMILSYLRRRFMELAATRIDGRLQLYVMNKLLRLPMSYFENNPVGYTAGRIGKVQQIRQFLTGQLFTTILDAVTLLGLIPALFIIEWRLAIWVLALAASIFLIIVAFLNPLARRYKQYVDAETLKGIYLIESLQGMRTIKSLALEGRRRLGWDHRVAESVSTKHAWGMMANYPQTLVLPFQRLIYIGSILIGCAFVLWSNDANHAVNPGALLAFGMLAGRTAAPLVGLATLLDSLGEIRGAVGEVASVMNVPPEQERGQSGLRQPIQGGITFDKVQFRYAPGSPLALNDATFEIRAGTIFGIMGRSGSGKTTITRLLQGLNRTYEGMIKIDGMDLREIDLHHLRTNIGVVPQENFLFSGTVRENIGMAKPGATFPQIVRAAQLAGAEEFIERMPRGYETMLQEGASNLSGGQRQRLALARALILEPPVLILDEATSALDAESEAIINANLVRIAQDRTIICVSHRLAMLVPADAILVMEQGKAYDIGRHEELMHRCDIYKHMWHQQNRHLEVTPLGRPVLARA